MKKKTITAALTLALAAGICGSVYADTKVVLKIDDTVMAVNGAEKTIDTPPTIVNSRTLVPVRAIVEALDGSVEWDAETKTAVLDTDGGRIELTIDSSTALLNGEEKTLDTAPAIIGGRTMLPLRFVAESMGYDTDWDGETKTITVTRQDAHTDPEYADGYELTHIGTDGNYYVETSGRILVKNETGRIIDEFAADDKMEWLYTDKNGGECKYIFENEQMYFVKADGTKVLLHDTDDMQTADKDGNIYVINTHSAQTDLLVKNSRGDVVEKYREKLEYHSFYTDKNGKTALYVYSKDEKADDGFLYPDGRYVSFMREYPMTYLSDDGVYYGTLNLWLVPIGKDGRPEEDMLLCDRYDVYTDKNGNEYHGAYNEDGGYTIEYPDGSKVKLTEKEESAVSDEYGEFSAMYYEGSDGNTYVDGSGYDYCVLNEKGDTVLEMMYSGYCEEYKGKKGVYKINTSGGNHSMTGPDGEKVGLTETYG